MQARVQDEPLEPVCGAQGAQEAEFSVRRVTSVEFTGTWYIYEMEAWDEDYANMEVRAYLRIGANGLGDFQ
jgi:hypothetical protein